MNTSKTIIFSALIYCALAFFISADDPAFAFTLNFTPKNKEPSREEIKKTQPAENPQVYVKPDNSEIARNEKRIILNIPRGDPANDGKFTLGVKHEAFREQVEKLKEKKTAFEKEIGLVSSMDTTGRGRGIYTLKDCIDVAVANHLPLQIAKKSVRLAEMRLYEARRNMLPSATIDFQTYSGRINDLRYIGRKQTIEGQQPVFHGGELLYTMKQSEVNLEITKNDYNRIRNELALQVKKAYYTLAKAKGNFKMQQELSKEVARVLDMVTRQSEAGVTSKLELLNVTSQAGQVKYQLASAEGDLEVAELILQQAMNIDPKERVDVKDDLRFNNMEIDYEKAVAIAMVNRPEMKINAMMIDYYNYGKKIAKAKLWPKFDILGSWGLSKEEFAGNDLGLNDNNAGNDQIDEKLQQQWYAGVKASMPFWGSTTEYSWTAEAWPPAISTFRGTEAKTEDIKFKVLDKLESLSERQLSDIDFDKARQELTKVRQDMVLEVKEGCFNYKKALIQAETAENKVKYQAGDLELVKLKRGLDEAQDSNVIDSMIKLAQEKFGYLQALADCHITLATINKAIGIEDYYKDE